MGVNQRINQRNTYEIARLMISKGANNLNDIFEIACLKGSTRLIHILFYTNTNYRSYNIKSGLSSALNNGHTELVKLFIYLFLDDVYDWNYGLRSACKNGHLSLAEYMNFSGSQ